MAPSIQSSVFSYVVRASGIPSTGSSSKRGVLGAGTARAGWTAGLAGEIDARISNAPGGEWFRETPGRPATSAAGSRNPRARRPASRDPGAAPRAHRPDDLLGLVA